MNRGRGRGRAGNFGGYSRPRGAGNSAHRHSPLRAGRPPEDSLCAEESEKKILGQMSVGSVSKHSEHKPKSSTTFQQKWLPVHRHIPLGADRPPEDSLGAEESEKEILGDSRGAEESEKKILGQMSVGSVSKHSEHKPKSSTTFQQKWLPVHRHIPLGADRPPEDSLGAEESEKEILGDSRGAEESEKKILGQMSVGSVSKHSEHKPKSGTTHQEKWFSYISKDGVPIIRRNQQGMNSPDGVASGSKRSKCLVTSDSAYKQDFPPLSGHSGSEGLDGGRIQIGQISGGMTADCNALHHDLSEKLTISGLQSETLLPSQSARKAEPAPSKGPKSSTSHNNSKHSEHSADITLRHEFSEKFIISSLQSETQLPSQSAKKDEPAPSKGPKISTGHNNLKHSEHSVVLEPFDICPKTGTSITLKPPLLAINRQRRNVIKQSMEGQNGSILRSGMIHLQGYISLSDQVMIVKLCQHLGLGSGGFYQPGYRDGGKLQLRMMCLGKNWDPESRKYGDDRPLDGAKPPNIPDKFYQLVENAITDSHSIIKKHSKASNVENILPSMSPDICLANFYTVNGRLGLHQDRDESQESLDKELPVVSFSIGDSADFLYGDQRDEDKAEKVKLESGDVIIFGGKSRHVFHGVTAIHPNTAPKPLLEETNLRPGRLNLTFRQY